MGDHSKPSLGGRRGAAEPDPVDLLNIEERRASLRRPTFKAGDILVEGGACIPCIVRNISESGCLIKLENAAALPDLVEIRIDLDKPSRQAEIIWRCSTLAGAMFVRKPS